MVGVVVGDCLGATLEFEYLTRIPMQKVEHKWRRDFVGAEEEFPYTDDTAMARQVMDFTILFQESLFLARLKLIFSWPSR